VTDLETPAELENKERINNLNGELKVHSCSVPVYEYFRLIIGECVVNKLDTQGKGLQQRDELIHDSTENRGFCHRRHLES